jgi:hypothetical protein
MFVNALLPGEPAATCEKDHSFAAASPMGNSTPSSSKHPRNRAPFPLWPSDNSLRLGMNGAQFLRIQPFTQKIRDSKRICGPGCSEKNSAQRGNPGRVQVHNRDRAPTITERNDPAPHPHLTQRDVCGVQNAPFLGILGQVPQFQLDMEVYEGRRLVRGTVTLPLIRQENPGDMVPVARKPPVERTGEDL